LILFIAALVAFIVWTTVATNPVWKAEEMSTASFLLRFCKLKPAEAFTNPNAAYFHGRCIGVLENLKLTMEMLPQQNPALCTKIPAGTTLSQMRDVIMKYADEYPDQSNNDLGRFAYTALHQAWPCKGGE
jgi:hypothetical protein